MSRQKWDGTLNEELMTDFILYLWEGFKKFGDDKYADHIIYYGVRKVTEAIGLTKELKISEKAKLNQSGINVKEHKKPAIQFYQEFRDKNSNNCEFTKADVERWFKEAEMAIISKEEDQKLTEKGWRDKNRPIDAYDQIGIKLISAS